MQPELLRHPSYNWAKGPIDVADFTGGDRPAFRVKCHCRNCGWEGQARFKIGTLIELWAYCPQCERRELSCHGGFVNRDEQTQEEAWEHYRANPPISPFAVNAAAYKRCVEEVDDGPDV